MAAPMINTFACRRCLQINFGLLNNAYREYRSKQPRSTPKRIVKDPRQNAQYPYTPGDPQHEELLAKLMNKSGFDSADNKKIFNLKSKKAHATGKDFVSLQNKPGHLKDGSMKDSKAHVSQYGHIYEKLKDGDLRLGRTILKAKTSNESETILLEGYRLIRDAIHHGAEIKYLYFSTEDLLRDLPPSILHDVQIFKILYRDMKIWSDTATPSGIMGVFKKPKQGESCSYEGPRLPLTVILDRIKDPGNVGTLIRTAAAIGCERVLVLKGCADVWEGKVLRSGMGGHFAVPIYNDLSWSQVYGYMEDSTQLFLADARAESEVITDFDNKLSAEEVDYASSSESDSDSDSDSSSSDVETDDSSVDDFKPNAVTNTSGQNSVFDRVSFPVISYSNMIFHPTLSGKEESVALVIGNETEGLSSSAKKFAYNCYGTFVTVPMNPAVDSLNTAVAGSIILYEIRRKMLELESTSSSSVI